MPLEPFWNINYSYNHSHRHFFDYLDQSTLSQHLAFISEHTVSPNMELVHVHAKKILDCKKQTGRLPVLCWDSNPRSNTDNYLLLLDQLIGPESYFVLSPDMKVNTTYRSNIAPFPSCLCMQNLTNQPMQVWSKPYRISFLSGTARYNRLKLFEKIKPYITDQDIVVVNKFNIDHVTTTYPALISEIDNNLTQDLPWQSKPGLIDTDQTKTNADMFHRIDHPAYLACVNITGETNYDNSLLFISEKTWKAYIAGCLVVNFGTVNLSHELEKLGLWIWKDYDVSDSEDQLIRKIIDLFQHPDIQGQYQQYLEKVIYNQKLVGSKNFVKKLAQTAFDKLESAIRL